MEALRKGFATTQPLPSEEPQLFHNNVDGPSLSRHLRTVHFSYRKTARRMTAEVSIEMNSSQIQNGPSTL